MTNSRPVYSTESGRICPKCGKTQSQCVCKKGKQKAGPKAPSDGIIRIQRE